jgi:hypothetical protein
MDVGGVLLASLVIVLAIPFAFEIRRRPENDGTKTLMTAALIAAVALGVLKVVNYSGLMAEGPLYWTLEIALSVLFFAMLYQLVRGKRTA